jgi:cysteine desulfurase/selenocysteine lyase
VPVSEHHSNFLPFLQSAKEKGITFTVCPCDQYGKVDILELSKLLKAKKSFVSCAHITNTLGTVQDIKSITELVHRYDGIIGIDGSQSCAHLPIHLSSLDVDFFVGAGHKMYGPTGASFFFMKENFLKTLSPLFLGGGIGEDVFFDSYTLKKYPTVFEAGTPPIAEVIGLSSAVSYLESFGMDFVFAHMKSMTEKLRETLAVIPSVEILSPQDSLGIVSFRIKNESVFDTADFLAENNVCVRVGKHCAHPFVENTIHQSFLRMSVGIYTTKEDINKVGDLLGRDFCKRN